MPRVSLPPTTTAFSARAAAGSSHSKVTPTSWSPSPSAYTISVAAGSSDTTRTPASLAGPGERPGQLGQPGGHRPVVRPRAALLPGHQTGVEEHLEVVADRRLAQAERLGEVADAGLAAVVRLDQAQQPPPRGVGDRLEHGRELGRP